MTTAQLIADIEARPMFRKWAQPPVVAETLGDIEKWHGVAYVDTSEGFVNTFNIWFMVDTETGEANWQNVDTLNQENNASQIKVDALTDYLKSTFVAFFVKNIDVVNRWAEAEVFEVSGQDLVRKSVLVYKPGSNPVTHKVIV